MTGRAAGALSISGVLAFFENCTFFANSAPSGPAVLNIGTSDEDPIDLEFGSNSLVCDNGQFIDYTEPVPSEDAAASFDVADEVTVELAALDGLLQLQNRSSKRFDSTLLVLPLICFRHLEIIGRRKPGRQLR